MTVRCIITTCFICSFSFSAFAEQIHPTGASLDLQEKCAKQAREQFKNDGWGEQKMAGYSSHYNDKLNKCFVWILATTVDNATGNITTSQILEDAFEGKVFGSYIWVSDKVKKYWEVPPQECDMILITGEKKNCVSSDEFDELANYYMQ